MLVVGEQEIAIVKHFKVFVLTITIDLEGRAIDGALVLVHKPERRVVYAQIDYLGFEIPDAWVVGCGLDWAEKYGYASCSYGRRPATVSSIFFCRSNASVGLFFSGSSPAA